MAEWLSFVIAGVALVLGAVNFVYTRRRDRRQVATEQAVARIEAERLAEELRPRLYIDESPWPQAEGFFTLRVRSQCDRALHVSGVRALDRAALPSAVAGLVAPTTTSPVHYLELDQELPPHDAFLLDLVRRDGTYRTDGTGQLQVDVDEPGTDRSWQITLTVRLPARTAGA